MDQPNAEDNPKLKKMGFNLASCFCPQKISCAKRRDAVETKAVQTGQKKKDSRREAMDKKAAQAKEKKRDSLTELEIPPASPAKSFTKSPLSAVDIKVTSREGSLAKIQPPNDLSKPRTSLNSAEPRFNTTLAISKKRIEDSAKAVRKSSDTAAVQPLANLQEETVSEKVAEKQECPIDRKEVAVISESRKLAKELLGSDFEAVDRKQQELIRGKEKSGSSSNGSRDKNKLIMTVEEELEYMTQLGKIRLRGVNDEIIRASTLWQESPVLLLLLRRPGCVMCRTESLKLEQIADRLDALGVKRVAIVFEWLELEIEEYLKNFWSGSIYLDPGREFYKALNGGEVKQGSVISVMLNPMSRYWKNFTAAKVILKDQPYNFKGELATLGGCIIMRPGLGGVQYMFREVVFGDPLRVKLILDECTAAAASKVPNLPGSPVGSIEASRQSSSFSQQTSLQNKLFRRSDMGFRNKSGKTVEANKEKLETPRLPRRHSLQPRFPESEAPQVARSGWDKLRSVSNNAIVVKSNVTTHVRRQN